MAYGVNVAENIACLEVYPADGFDQPRHNPEVVEGWLKNKLRHEMKALLEDVLEFECDEQIRAIRYERGALERQSYRNGYRQRDLSTTMGTVRLQVPRAREPLSFSVFRPYQRRWQELDLLLLETHIGGVSCRQAGERIAGILGRKWSGATLAKLKQRIVEQLKSFRLQPLEDEYETLVVDGMYVGIRQCGQAKRPVVAVIGIKADGQCDLLALRVCYSENSTEVEGLLRSVKQRGLHGINLKVVTIDGDKGLEKAVYAVWGHVRIQDCTFHRINRIGKNAANKKRGRRMMQEASELFAIENPRTRQKRIRDFCQQYRENEPKAIAAFERNLERSFETQCLPTAIRKKANTSGLCEGLFKQIRPRIKQIGRFETPESVELYCFAIASQKKWIGIPGRKHLSPLIQTFTHNN